MGFKLGFIWIWMNLEWLNISELEGGRCGMVCCILPLVLKAGMWKSMNILMLTKVYIFYSAIRSVPLIWFCSGEIYRDLVVRRVTSWKILFTKKRLIIIIYIQFVVISNIWLLFRCDFSILFLVICWWDWKRRFDVAFICLG